MSIIRPTTIGPGEKFIEMKVLRRLENFKLILVFANTVNKSFIFIFFQLLYTICVTLTLQNLLDFDGVVTQLHLTFLKFQMLDSARHPILFLSQIIVKYLFFKITEGPLEAVLTPTDGCHATEWTSYDTFSTRSGSL